MTLVTPTFDVSTRLRESTKLFLARNHRLFIDGQWTDAANGVRRDVIDPATGSAISTMSNGDGVDIELAVKAAREAFDHGPWRTLPLGERASLLWKIGCLIDENAEELAELEVLNAGTTWNLARNFVRLAAEHFRYYSGWATKIVGNSIPVTISGEWHAYTVREPVGVVGQVIPWNAPLLLAAWKLAPALAAGCTVVLKPAEDTPLTAIRLAELCNEAGLPHGVVNVVTGDGKAGAALVEHPDVDKVSFTGSTDTGKAIVRAAAGNLKRVSLELGGKSPVFVFPDANLEHAIPGVADAVLGNSGQSCTAGSRLYVHESIYDRVIDGVVEYASSLKLGHGLDPATDLGPLISQRQKSRVTKILQAGIDEGAKIRCGGGQHEGPGFFFRPTVLTNVAPGMTVYREEIFGPVISAMRMTGDNLDALVREGNNTTYGLAASIWTSDLRVAHKLASRIRAGMIWVNAHNRVDAAIPFGGYKQSGWGRELGLQGIEAYTELKSVGMLLD
jgi:phenylacetaldehyde dehydrogenase